MNIEARSPEPFDRSHGLPLRPATVVILLVAFWNLTIPMRLAGTMLDPRLASRPWEQLVIPIAFDQNSWALVAVIAFFRAAALAKRRRSMFAAVLELTLTGVALISARWWGLIAVTAMTGLNARPTLSAFLLSAPFHFVVYAAPAAVGYGMTLWVQSQRGALQNASLMKELAEAKLDALRLQLNPHFLFNALNSVASLVHKDPARADNALVALASLLRASLNDSPGHLVTIEAEMKILDAYLELELARFDWLSVSVHVDEDVRDAAVPPFILQTLVENAIRHGVGPRGGNGHIEVKAWRAGAAIVLRVTDNGVGMGGREETDSFGIGLRNARARLHQLFGDDARLHLSDGPAGGVVAEFRVPAGAAIPDRTGTPSFAQ